MSRIASKGGLAREARSVWVGRGWGAMSEGAAVGCRDVALAGGVGRADWLCQDAGEGEGVALFCQAQTSARLDQSGMAESDG